MAVIFLIVDLIVGRIFRMDGRVKKRVSEVQVEVKREEQKKVRCFPPDSTSFTGSD